MVALTAIAISPLGFLLAFRRCSYAFCFLTRRAGVSVHRASDCVSLGTFLPSCDRACHLDKSAFYVCIGGPVTIHASNGHARPKVRTYERCRSRRLPILLLGILRSFSYTVFSAITLQSVDQTCVSPSVTTTITGDINDTTPDDTV
jgi:hypothetical protein